MAYNTLINSEERLKSKQTKDLSEGTSKATINQRKLEIGHL